MNAPINRLALVALALAVGASCFAIVRKDGIADSEYVTKGNNYPQVFRMQYTGYDVSAVLIGPNTLLTAGHNYPGLTTSVQVNSGTITNTTSNWIRHPEFKSGDEYTPQFDFCLARLSTAVQGITPVQLMGFPSVGGMQATWVGYGSTGSPATGSAANTTKARRAGTNTLDTATAWPDVLVSDFDSGTTADNTLPKPTSPFGSPTPTSMECAVGSGDSGGGVFVENNGTYLAGIIIFNTRLDQNNAWLYKYGTISAASMVPKQYYWIRAIAEPAGSVGGRLDMTFLAAKAPAQVVTVTLRQPGTGTVVETKSVTRQSSGYFAYTSSLRGTYDVYVKGTTWLRKKLGTVTLNNIWGTYIAGELKNGDCNGDNVVNTDDYTIVSAAWDKGSSDSGFDPRADLNQDGIVGTDDYLAISAAFDSQGD
jgi:hypothetical protein